MLADTDSLDRYVTFRLAGERYAVPVRRVQEIIRLPEITRVPQAPAYVEGLANLRGTIITVISGRAKLGLPRQEDEDATRVLIFALNGRIVGYIVDAVLEVISVSQDALEGVPPELAEQSYITGTVRTDQGIIMLLDPEKVVGGSYETGLLAEETTALSDLTGQKTAAPAEVKENELQLVTFTVGQTEYALDLTCVKEIVAYPEHLSTVPTFPYYAEGIMVLRDHLLPVISLAKLFGSQEMEDKSRSRIIVLTDEGKSVGVVGASVSGVSEVLRVPAEAVAQMPDYLAGSGGTIQLTGVCKLDNGNRLVYLLDPRFFLNLSEIRLSSSTGGSSLGTRGEEAVKSHRSGSQYLLFKLGGQDFVTDIASVKEILDAPEIFPVPKAPDFVEGVVNIRGSIVPVIDLRKRLSTACASESGQKRIMVTDLGGALTGFLVDTVKEVRYILFTDIVAPDVLYSVGYDSTYLTGIAKSRDGKVAFVLDLQCLLNVSERKALNALKDDCLLDGVAVAND